MIVPGSHLSGRHPTKDEAANSGIHIGAIPLQGPRGCCAIYDGRLWHQMGQNTGRFIDRTTGSPWRIGVFTHFVAAQMRSQENFACSALPEVVENASVSLRERLGLIAWNGVHGRVGEASPLTATEEGLPFMSTRQQLDHDTSAYDPQPHAERNLESLREQVDCNGYCVLPSAFDTQLQGALLARLEDQAAAEIRAGVGTKDVDGTQLVLTLLNKGAVFQPLLRPSPARQLVEHIIGAEYLLSQATGRLSGSSAAMPTMRDTQWWMPQPIKRSDVVPQIRPGNISPTTASVNEWQAQEGEWIAPAASARVLWALEDQTFRVVRGSHRTGKHPTVTAMDDAIPVSVTAGSCLVLDGRLWFAHSSAAHLDTSWCGPQFRPEENHVLGMSEEVLNNMEESSRALLGFKVWHSYGQIPGAPYDGMFPVDKSVDPQIGIMRMELDATVEQH